MQIVWRDRLRAVVLALVAFVIAHDLIFLDTYGASYQAVLARTGHGDSWTVAVLVIGALATALVAAALLRLRHLAEVAKALDSRRVRVESSGLADFVHYLLRAWLVILPVALGVFVAVENLEHLEAGLPVPGLGVLGSIDYHATLAIFALVSLLAATVDALYRWRRDLLLAQIDAARAAWTRAARHQPPPGLPWVETRHGSIVGHRLAGRAPPAIAP